MSPTAARISGTQIGVDLVMVNVHASAAEMTLSHVNARVIVEAPDVPVAGPVRGCVMPRR